MNLFTMRYYKDAICHLEFDHNHSLQLYPPGQDHFLSVMPGKTSGFPLDSTKYNSPIDAYEPNLEKHPLFVKATAIEFDQLPGELLFISTGWFHQMRIWIIIDHYRSFQLLVVKGTAVEFDQLLGELLCIPTRWLHQVRGVFSLICNI